MKNYIYEEIALREALGLAEPTGHGSKFVRCWKIPTHV
jgi:hypothetical protein